MEDVLNAQREFWESSFSETPDMFGEEPAYPARKAAELFKKEGRINILELGCGQGRDTIFFAKNGFRVHVLDYSGEAIKALISKAQSLGLSGSIIATRHDVREPLPFEDEFIEGCYSHMLYCMALTTGELAFLSREIRRVLKPRGLNVYTARTTNDAHYGTGIHRGEDMYEIDGFIVHFFSREKVRRFAEGYQILSLDEFEEGELPRRLFFVTLRKES